MPRRCEKFTNISTYSMYPSFLHFFFVWKLKESNLFSFWSNTPAFFDANVHCDASLASFWWTRLRSQPRVRHLWIRRILCSIEVLCTWIDLLIDKFFFYLSLGPPSLCILSLLDALKFIHNKEVTGAYLKQKLNTSIYVCISSSSQWNNLQKEM